MPGAVPFTNASWNFESLEPASATSRGPSSQVTKMALPQPANRVCDATSGTKAGMNFSAQVRISTSPDSAA